MTSEQGTFVVCADKARGISRTTVVRTLSNAAAWAAAAVILATTHAAYVDKA